MTSQIVPTIFIVTNLLFVTNCRELKENLLDLDNFVEQSPFFDDVDADIDLSRTKLLLKNKRFDNDNLYSYNPIDDTGSSSNSDVTEPWPGRWLPEKVEPKHRVVSKRLNDTMQDSHVASMTSSINPECDDGKTNISVDWSGSPENHTCFRRTFFTPDPSIPGFITHDYIPTEYHARHVCMKDEIHYSTDLPTFGPHRPAWARYGEYTFLPVQRWLHNLEHGGIVMLYHPCAHPIMVSKLRDIVTSCLYRHVITPYTLLSQKRPLALVSWGWSMTMSYVDQHYVEQFIKDHALQGPEQLSKDGDYDYLIKNPADIVTTLEDESVCPYSGQRHM